MDKPMLNRLDSGAGKSLVLNTSTYDWVRIHERRPVRNERGQLVEFIVVVALRWWAFKVAGNKVNRHWR
jgi:hypothetical protein